MKISSAHWSIFTAQLSPRFSIADVVDPRSDRTHSKMLFLELRALAELLGPYGIRFIQEALSIQIGYQIQEILTTVKKNRNTLR